MENNLDVRDKAQLIQAFDIAKDFVCKDYLVELTNFEVLPISEKLENSKVCDLSRVFKINKMVYDKEEIMLDKLINVYTALGGNEGSLILLINSNGDSVDFYMGVKATNSPSKLAACYKTMQKTLLANFPGSDILTLKNLELEELMTDVFQNDLEFSNKVISSVSGIGALKDEEKSNFIQGIEKLIETAKGQSYTLLLVADPVSQAEIINIKQGYETLGSQLVPFAKSELSLSENESYAVTEGLTKGFSYAISESIAKTQSYTETTATSAAMTHSSSNTSNLGGAAVSLVGAGIGSIFGPIGTLIGGQLGNLAASAIGSKTEGTSSTETTNTSTANTQGSTNTKGETQTDSQSTNQSDTTTSGSGKTLNISFENKSVQNLIVKIDSQLERLSKSEDYGLWNCAMYCIADDTSTTKLLANTYKALIRGKDSSVENAAVSTWDNSDRNKLDQLTKYVQKFHHPLFNYSKDIGINMPYITAGSLVSSEELALHAHTPTKSIQGLPVLSCTSFGRNIVTYDQRKSNNAISIGKIFHMGQEENTTVDLDVDSLSMHTFITGSTGSGKSTTIYEILHLLSKKNINWLVVEPTKGEYKQVFGGQKGVKVFSTNSKISPLLKINPFKFSDEIHVLEHIDRMIEIFNACWPMYAAMPAILKQSVEEAYINCGWDLEESINYHGENIYPTFVDLLNTLSIVINNSDYSQELKSNYTGALVTRVKSLTNGINGNIFVSDEIPEEILFDNNCIVDLSRVGSIETKSLIMGILFMRLQEYRTAKAVTSNCNLRHVTVLEEAHHLLRRTSVEQSQEGANLQGLAVEMITNAIAEMRTYGEGFIIADQSPSLLDLSAIRNTNTKIILRLPDEADRQLVGKSANLNDEQIEELARLRVGVGAIYQNNWQQPILCAVEKFTNSKSYIYDASIQSTLKVDEKKSLLMRLLLVSRTNEVLEYKGEQLKELQSFVTQSTLKEEDKLILSKNLQQLIEFNHMELWEQKNFGELSFIITNLIDGRNIMRYASKAYNLEQFTDILSKQIRRRIVTAEDNLLEGSIIQCILKELSREEADLVKLYTNWVDHFNDKGGAVC